MGPILLEVTDTTVGVTSGQGLPIQSGHASPELVRAALEWIDEPVGLLGQRPVAVADMWRSLVTTLVGQGCDSIVVVHPPDWPRHRIERVLAAANTVADDVVAASRDQREEIREAMRQENIATGATSSGADDHNPRRRPIPVATSATALAVAAVMLVAVCITVAARSAPANPDAAAVAVVEGRMTVLVPPRWTVERVTSGPGSRRLQASPPGDPQIALHLTSSYAPELTRQRAGDAISRAMADEPAGVFVDLLVDHTTDRPAVTYRELRPGRLITWSVVLAGVTRISIGCQSPPGRQADIRTACEQAIRSARET